MLSLGVAGCSSGSSDSSSSASPAESTQSASPSPTGTPVKFKSTISSVRSWTDEVGEKGSDADTYTYGVNILEGNTTINDVTVRVRMLGTVDYTNGSGPFGSFLELVWNDGTTLGMRQAGQATLDEDTEETTFEGDLEVIGGSGQAAGTTGSGTWTGERETSLGGAVSIKVTLDLTNAPKLITGEDSSGGKATASESYSATIAP